MPKNSICSLSAKIEICTLSTPSLTTSSTHTKTSNFGYAGFQENSTHLHSNQPKLSPVSESSTHLLQKTMYASSRSPQARELCPQTYSLSLLLEWSQVTHIPTSIKSGRAYKPKSQLSTLLLPDNCVMIPLFQDGSLPFHHTHKHSSPLRQALHTQIANHHIQRARKSSYFFIIKCWGGFLQSSVQPHESAARPLQRATGHIKGTRPPCWSHENFVLLKPILTKGFTY